MLFFLGLGEFHRLKVSEKGTTEGMIYYPSFENTSIFVLATMKVLLSILGLFYTVVSLGQTIGGSATEKALVGKWTFDKEEYYTNRTDAKPYTTTTHKSPATCYLKLDTKPYFDHVPWKEATNAMACQEGYDVSLAGRWRVIKCGSVSHPDDCLEVITATGSDVYHIVSVSANTLKLQLTGGTETLLLYYFHK
jgi:hypothetical protein